jgi:hypothetical protein
MNQDETTRAGPPPGLLTQAQALRDVAAWFEASTPLGRAHSIAIEVTKIAEWIERMATISARLGQQARRSRLVREAARRWPLLGRPERKSRTYAPQRRKNAAFNAQADETSPQIVVREGRRCMDAAGYAFVGSGNPNTSLMYDTANPDSYQPHWQVAFHRYMEESAAKNQRTLAGQR